MAPHNYVVPSSVRLYAIFNVYENQQGARLDLQTTV
jgi:hypothetical protein